MIVDHPTGTDCRIFAFLSVRKIQKHNGSIELTISRYTNFPKSVTPGSPPNQMLRVKGRLILNIISHPIIAEGGTSYFHVMSILVQQNLRDFRRYRLVFKGVNVVARATAWSALEEVSRYCEFGARVRCGCCVLRNEPDPVHIALGILSSRNPIF